MSDAGQEYEYNSRTGAMPELVKKTAAFGCDNYKNHNKIKEIFS